MKNIRMVLLLIIFSSIFIWTYSGGIKWGTPNLKRSRQIFKNEEELRKFVPQMVKMREEFYKKRSELYSDKGEIDKSQIKTKMDEVFWEHTGKVKVMDIIPRETILNAIRSYFISTNLSDEGQALFPLTSMNPGKLDFDPKFYVYGGLYYYFVGISLAIGKILGFISLTHDIQHYFLNPEETANIYTIIRTINILAILIGAIIVFKIARQIFKHRITATLCLFLFLISPILFLQTHLSKPHAIAMLFLATGLLLIYQSFQTGNIKYEIAAAISFGLSAALLVINLFFVIFFITADIVRRKKLSFITYLCFFLAFAIPNYFIFLHPKMFLRYIISLKIYSGYSTLDFFESIKFTWHAFYWGIHYIIIPFFLLGVIYYLQKKERFETFLLISGILFIVFNILMLRHQGVWAIGYPFIAIIISAGFEKLYFSKRIYKTISVTFLILTVYILSAKVLFYRQNLFPRYGNMTEAGDWINKNIPASSKIGIQGGWLLPGNVPAFRFFNYRLVYLPNTNIGNLWNNKNIPEYVFTIGSIFDSEPSFREKYNILSEWHEPSGFMGISFEKYWVPTENMNVRIYKRVKG